MLQRALPIEDDTELHRALRKGRVRRGTVVILGVERELTIAQLASRLRVERNLVVCAIMGDGRKFREAFALGRLGIIRWVWRTSGWSVSLTPRGLELAAKLATGWDP